METWYKVSLRKESHHYGLIAYPKFCLLCPKSSGKHYKKCFKPKACFCCLYGPSLLKVGDVCLSLYFEKIPLYSDETSLGWKKGQDDGNLNCGGGKKRSMKSSWAPRRMYPTHIVLQTKEMSLLKVIFCDAN